MLRPTSNAPSNSKPEERGKLSPLRYLYQRNNQIDRALAALRKAVELEPHYYRNQWNLAAFYLDQGRYKEAIEHLQEFAREADAFRLANARYDLAGAYTATGAFAKALEKSKCP